MTAPDVVADSAKLEAAAEAPKPTTESKPASPDQIKSGGFFRTAVNKAGEVAGKGFSWVLRREGNVPKPSIDTTPPIEPTIVTEASKVTAADLKGGPALKNDQNDPRTQIREAPKTAIPENFADLADKVEQGPPEDNLAAVSKDATDKAKSELPSSDPAITAEVKKIRQEVEERAGLTSALDRMGYPATDVDDPAVQQEYAAILQRTREYAAAGLEHSDPEAMLHHMLSVRDRDAIPGRVNENLTTEGGDARVGPNHAAEADARIARRQEELATGLSELGVHADVAGNKNVQRAYETVVNQNRTREQVGREPRNVRKALRWELQQRGIQAEIPDESEPELVPPVPVAEAVTEDETQRARQDILKVIDDRIAHLQSTASESPSGEGEPNLPEKPESPDGKEPPIDGELPAQTEDVSSAVSEAIAPVAATGAAEGVAADVSIDTPAEPDSAISTEAGGEEQDADGVKVPEITDLTPGAQAIVESVSEAGLADASEAEIRKKIRELQHEYRTDAGKERLTEQEMDDAKKAREYLLAQKQRREEASVSSMGDGEGVMRTDTDVRDESVVPSPLAQEGSTVAEAPVLGYEQPLESQLSATPALAIPERPAVITSANGEASPSLGASAEVVQPVHGDASGAEAKGADAAGAAEGEADSYNPLADVLKKYGFTEDEARDKNVQMAWARILDEANASNARGEVVDPNSLTEKTRVLAEKQKEAAGTLDVAVERARADAALVNEKLKNDHIQQEEWAYRAAERAGKTVDEKGEVTTPVEASAEDGKPDELSSGDNGISVNANVAENEGGSSETVEGLDEGRVAHLLADYRDGKFPDGEYSTEDWARAWELAKLQPTFTDENLSPAEQEARQRFLQRAEQAYVEVTPPEVRERAEALVKAVAAYDRTGLPNAAIHDATDEEYAAAEMAYKARKANGEIFPEDDGIKPEVMTLERPQQDDEKAAGPPKEESLDAEAPVEEDSERVDRQTEGDDSAPEVTDPHRELVDLLLQDPPEDPEELNAYNQRITTLTEGMSDEDRNAVYAEVNAKSAGHEEPVPADSEEPKPAEAAAASPEPASAQADVAESPELAPPVALDTESVVAEPVVDAEKRESDPVLAAELQTGGLSEDLAGNVDIQDIFTEINPYKKDGVEKSVKERAEEALSVWEKRESQRLREGVAKDLVGLSVTARENMVADLQEKYGFSKEEAENPELQRIFLSEMAVANFSAKIHKKAEPQIARLRSEARKQWKEQQAADAEAPAEVTTPVEVSAEDGKPDESSSTKEDVAATEGGSQVAQELADDEKVRAHTNRVNDEFHDALGELYERYPDMGDEFEEELQKLEADRDAKLAAGPPEEPESTVASGKTGEENGNEAESPLEPAVYQAETAEQIAAGRAALLQEHYGFSEEDANNPALQAIYAEVWKEAHDAEAQDGVPLNITEIEGKIKAEWDKKKTEAAGPIPTVVVPGRHGIPFPLGPTPLASVDGDVTVEPVAEGTVATGDKPISELPLEERVQKLNELAAELDARLDAKEISAEDRDYAETQASHAYRRGNEAEIALANKLARGEITPAEHEKLLAQSSKGPNRVVGGVRRVRQTLGGIRAALGRRLRPAAGEEQSSGVAPETSVSESAASVEPAPAPIEPADADVPVEPLDATAAVAEPAAETPPAVTEPVSPEAEAAQAERQRFGAQLEKLGVEASLAQDPAYQDAYKTVLQQAQQRAAQSRGMFSDQKIDLKTLATEAAKLVSYRKSMERKANIGTPETDEQKSAREHTQLVDQAVGLGVPRTIAETAGFADIYNEELQKAIEVAVATGKTKIDLKAVAKKAQGTAQYHEAWRPSRERQQLEGLGYTPEEARAIQEGGVYSTLLAESNGQPVTKEVIDAQLTAKQQEREQEAQQQVEAAQKEAKRQEELNKILKKVRRISAVVRPTNQNRALPLTPEESDAFIKDPIVASLLDAKTLLLTDIDPQNREAIEQALERQEQARVKAEAEAKRQEDLIDAYDAAPEAVRKLLSKPERHDEVISRRLAEQKAADEQVAEEQRTAAEQKVAALAVQQKAQQFLDAVGGDPTGYPPELWPEGVQAELDRRAAIAAEPVLAVTPEPVSGRRTRRGNPTTSVTQRPRRQRSTPAVGESPEAIVTRHVTEDAAAAEYDRKTQGLSQEQIAFMGLGEKPAGYEDAKKREQARAAAEVQKKADNERWDEIAALKPNLTQEQIPDPEKFAAYQAALQRNADKAGVRDDEIAESPTPVVERVASPNQRPLTPEQVLDKLDQFMEEGMTLSQAKEELRKRGLIRPVFSPVNEPPRVSEVAAAVEAAEAIANGSREESGPKAFAPEATVSSGAEANASVKIPEAPTEEQIDTAIAQLPEDLQKRVKELREQMKKEKENGEDVPLKFWQVLLMVMAEMGIGTVQHTVKDVKEVVGAGK